MGRKKAYKIFDVNYLQHGEFTEDDLYYLFETPSFSYSLVVDMFKRTKQDLTDEKKIITLIKNDRDWMYKYYWTDKQREDFKEIVKNVYKNVHYYNDKEAATYADWWLFCYGFTNSKLKNNKNMQKLEND